MTMIYFAPKQSQNGVLCLFTSKFQTSTIGYQHPKNDACLVMYIIPYFSFTLKSV